MIILDKLNDFPEEILSCDLAERYSVKVGASGTKVVRVSVYEYVAPNLITPSLTLTLRSYGGFLKLPDLREYVQQAMRVAGLTKCKVEIHIGDSAFSAEQYANTIITYSEQSLSPGGKVPSNYDTSATRVMSFRYPDYQYSNNSNAGGSAFLNLPAEVEKDPDLKYFKSVLTATEYYRTPRIPQCAFWYRNPFNVWKLVEIFGSMKEKTSVEHETATSRGSVLQYNRKVTRTFSVAAAVIAECEQERLRDFASSHEARLYVKDLTPEESPRIIITESTLEINRSKQSDSQLKFTFRFDKDSPVISALNAERIFTEQFTVQFT